MVEAYLKPNNRTYVIMTLRVAVKYTSDGEAAFLGDGWGAYDVGGPYLIASAGTIEIPTALLQSRFGTTLCLRFAVSNRIESDSLEVVVKHDTQSYVTTIHRNELAEVVVTNLNVGDTTSCLLTVQALTLEQEGFDTVMRPAFDMLSIEALLLEALPKGISVG